MKIYLSKSNKSDYDVKAKLAYILQQNGYKISEYKGGPYEPKVLMKDIKAIFQVTHPEGYMNMPDSVTFGRGIYTEYTTAGVPAFLFDGEYFYKIDGGKLLNENDYMFRWATMKIIPVKLTIDDVEKVLSPNEKSPIDEYFENV